MKKMVIALVILILAGAGWWVFDRHVANHSPSDEIRQMVSAARIGDTERFIDGFTDESGRVIAAMLSLAEAYSHVRKSPIERLAEAQLVDETVNGDTAIVLMQTRDRTREIPMVWTSSGWKVDAFEMEKGWK